VFPERDMAAVKARYAQLHFFQEGACEGFLDLNASYNGVERKDKFQVQIRTPTLPATMPSLVETGGRTGLIARKHAITDLRDLHCNPATGVACLCVKQEEPKRYPADSSLLYFVEELVVPYLYGLSHFDEHGSWPWGEFSHGTIGIAEYYADDLSEASEALVRSTVDLLSADRNWREWARQISRPRPKRTCICGSGRPIVSCHRRAFIGLTKLHTDIQSLGMDVPQLLRK
jgi:hypothetical protein